MELLSFDVSLNELMVCDGSRTWPIENKAKQIEAVLSRYRGWSVVMEPTSTYHMELAQRAHRQGRKVYLVNPRDVRHYRESLSFRAKTDRIDAEVLHLYVVKHEEKLRVWAPLKPDLMKLKNAIRKWFHASQMRTRLLQIWKEESPELSSALEGLEKLLQAAEEEAIAMAQLVDEDCYRRTLEAPGVGPYSACALTFLLRSRPFENADAIVAFVGLDLVVEDSGKKKGQRYVSKRGDRTLRHALGCSGRGLLNTRIGRIANGHLKAKGRAFPERMIMASRKVIRTVFALDQLKTPFDPQKFKWNIDTQT